LNSVNFPHIFGLSSKIIIVDDIDRRIQVEPITFTYIMSQCTPDTKSTTTNGGGSRGHRPPNRGGIPAPQQKKQGLIPALGEHIFDYNVSNAAAQMQTTWEKIIKYVSSTYSNDISTELDTRKTLVLPPPEHSKETLDKHKEQEELRKTQLARTILGLKTDLKAHKSVTGHSARVAADMENEIESLTVAMKKSRPIVLEGDKKTAWETEWKNYNKRKQELIKHRGQCFGLICGQCTRTLIDKMEHDASWSTTITSGDPLLLYDLIEKTILAQSEETYPFAIIYKNERKMYLSAQYTTYQQPVVPPVCYCRQCCCVPRSGTATWCPSRLCRKATTWYAL
jgi:hypothetical protein